MKYCVYFLIDPETGVPFYVGSGNNKSGRKIGRPYEHFKPTMLNKNTHKSNKIKRLLNIGFTIKQIIDEFYFSNDRKECLDLEQMYLDLLKTEEFGGILYNVCTSVENTTTGIKLSEEHKKKINFSGKKHSEYTKEKISKGNSGKKRSEECLKTIGKWNIGNKYCFGIKRSEETKLKLSNIAKNRTNEHKEKWYAKMQIYWENKKALGFLDLGLGI